MLTLYKNIKNRRKELGMNQETLAKKVGYSWKSMVSKVERGEIDLSETMIKNFANALQISASDLMGWDEIKWNPKTQEIEVDDEGNIANSNRQLEAFISYLRRNEDFANRMMEYASFLLSKDKKKPESILNKLLKEHFEEWLHD